MAGDKRARIPKFKYEEEAAWWDNQPDFVAEEFERAATQGDILRRLPKSRSVTIRIAEKNLEAARELAQRKGLPYQTYMKMLLHQALERERSAS
jgi:predicted DNA binding CopG/RHH family protein